MDPKEKLIIALDVDSLAKAKPYLEALAPHVGYFKVGLELITAAGGPAAVHHVQRLGGQVFFDAKFNDIPNTVGAACREVSGLGVKFFTVHASAGRKAMEAAAQNKGSAQCYAVTVLTSLTDEQSVEIFGKTAQEKVIEFAHHALEAGVDGVICSPQELAALEQDDTLKKLKKITPGIRPTWYTAGDQQRVLTPAQAIQAGADHIVVGRPITRPPVGIGSPVDAVQKILAEIAEIPA